MENQNDGYSHNRVGTEHESFGFALWRKFPDECEDERGYGEQCEEGECGPRLCWSDRDVTPENEGVCDHVEDE